MGKAGCNVMHRGSSERLYQTIAEVEGRTYWAAAAKLGPITKHPGSVDKDLSWDVALDLRPL